MLCPRQKDLLKHHKPLIITEQDPLQLTNQNKLGVEDGILYLFDTDVSNTYVRIVSFDFSRAFKAALSGWGCGSLKSWSAARGFVL